MTDTITPFLPDHRELNAQRRLLAEQPDLSSIASAAAQRLLFTSLLDHLATVPPLVAVDSLIDEDLARVVSTVLDGEPRDLNTTPADLLSWLEPADDDAPRRYSLRLIQFLGRLLERYGDPENPAHPVGALHELVPLLPEPSVLDLSLDGAMQRFTPSARGREALGWTGTVCIPAGAYRSGQRLNGAEAGRCAEVGDAGASPGHPWKMPDRRTVRHGGNSTSPCRRAHRPWRSPVPSP